MKLHKYQLKTISYLSLSPREDNAFYFQDSERPTDAAEKPIEVNIIYPFYRYGMYNHYNPEKAKYYIPGSSIKGALRGKEDIPLMVDDISTGLNHKSFEIKTLYKGQYLDEEKSKSKNIPEPRPEGMDNQGYKRPKFSSFMENVGLEMLKPNVLVQGELFFDDDLNELFRNASQRSVKKVEQTLERIRAIQGTGYRNVVGDDFTDEISCICANTKSQIDVNPDANGYLLLLGGFKGLLNTILISNPKVRERVESALFVDQSLHLPHGLVRVKSVE